MRTQHKSHLSVVVNSLAIFCILLGPCAFFCSLFVMDGKGCSLSAQPRNAKCPSVPIWTYLNCIILKYTFILATCHQQTTRVLLDRTPCFAQCFLCSVEYAVSCGQITTRFLGLFQLREVLPGVFPHPQWQELV